MSTRFRFRFDPAYRWLARLFGVTPERAWVDLGEEELEARYGPWRVRTPLSNVAGVEATAHTPSSNRPAQRAWQSPIAA